MRPLAMIFVLWALAVTLVQRPEILQVREMVQALLLRAALYWAPVIEALRMVRW